MLRSARTLARRFFDLLAGPGLLAVVLIGCGDFARPEFPDVPSGASVVDQRGLKFAPDELRVSAGERVYFTNSERAPHTVSIEGENLSGNMVKGDVFVWTFDVPGEYKIACNYHLKMRATITVE